MMRDDPLVCCLSLLIAADWVKHQYPTISKQLDSLMFPMPSFVFPRNSPCPKRRNKHSSYWCWKSMEFALAWPKNCASTYYVHHREVRDLAYTLVSIDLSIAYHRWNHGHWSVCMCKHEKYNGERRENLFFSFGSASARLARYKHPGSTWDLYERHIASRAKITGYQRENAFLKSLKHSIKGSKDS